jgi:hypothetical protein
VDHWHCLWCVPRCECGGACIEGHEKGTNVKTGIVVLIILALLAGAWWHGGYHRGKIDALANAEAVNAAVAAAIETERQRQKGVNDAVQKQADTVRDINSGLIDDIAELRKRPGRVRTVIYPGATCQGATGAELSGEDAKFLSREAARADTIRAALIGCYAAYDAL